eukprot:NODE_354_length_2397_cov_50.243186_g329_i0.p1 GENE.NODE_354_length_2397_cov_50.243186_g329_i0~~NODE_354_length_2397_cov_50.243186_g329_i0.p1  ORF type:complete len:655 (+),score=145.10 NODE_354_length_2397_cov_50.243186_g329_i0:188-2152(+)
MSKEEPKKKKMSAKDKKRMKEQMKREELETRTRQIAEHMFKVHEKERGNQEKGDRQKRHLEQVRAEREEERLAHESKEFARVWADYTLRIDLALKEFNKFQDWANIVNVSTLPSVNNEADINSFLSVWREGSWEDAGNEDQKRDLDRDFVVIEQAVELIRLINIEIDKAKEARDAPAYTSKSKARVALHKQNMANLFQQIQNTLDRFTSNVMQYLDKYLDEGDDQPLTLCKESKSVKAGLWCGNKYPRVRSVDFSSLAIVISPKDGAHLPKQLNLMNNVAVRVLQLSFDPMCIYEKDDVGLEYYSLGNVLIVETMSVPQPAKHVKDWVLRMETQLAHDVQRIPYPPPVSDFGAPPPIRVSFQVPENIVVRHTAPVIGIWSQKHSCWLPDGTNDFTYDKTTRRATFLTQNLTRMAVIQEKGFDVPYEQWYMYPIDSESVMFVLEGRRRNEISDRQVHILVRNNLCKVVKPEEPELSALRSEWYSPTTLLRLLSNSGYHFILRDCDADYTPDILPKTLVMENKGYSDIALFCTTFEFASSRHNKFGEDRNMTLFRASRQMRDEESTRPLQVDLEDDDRWFTIRYEKERCVLTQSRESDEHANLEEMPGCETHLNLYMMFSAQFSQDVVEAHIGPSDLLLHNAVRQLLCLVRPFTWG